MPHEKLEALLKKYGEKVFLALTSYRILGMPRLPGMATGLTIEDISHLIDKGGDPTIRDGQGRDFLAVLSQSKHVLIKKEMLELLLSNGCDVYYTQPIPFVEGNKKADILFEMCWNNVTVNQDVAQILIEHFENKENFSYDAQEMIPEYMYGMMRNVNGFIQVPNTVQYFCDMCPTLFDNDLFQGENGIYALEGICGQRIPPQEFYSYLCGFEERGFTIHKIYEKSAQNEKIQSQDECEEVVLSLKAKKKIEDFLSQKRARNVISETPEPLF